MRIREYIGCTQFPCTGVNHTAYIIPDIELDPSRISIILVSEASPAKAEDYYYSAGESSFSKPRFKPFKMLVRASVPFGKSSTWAFTSPARSSVASWLMGYSRAQ